MSISTNSVTIKKSFITKIEDFQETRSKHTDNCLSVIKSIIYIVFKIVINFKFLINIKNNIKDDIKI